MLPPGEVLRECGATDKRGGETDLKRTLDNLRQITDNLRDLTENAKRYPSQLILGAPPLPAKGLQQ